MIDSGGLISAPRSETRTVNELFGKQHVSALRMIPIRVICEKW